MLLKKKILTVFVVVIFCWLGVCRSFRRTGLRAAAQELVQIAALAEGLSGRALQKLPLWAHAFFVRVTLAQGLPAVRNPSSATFVCFVLFWYCLVWWIWLVFCVCVLMFWSGPFCFALFCFGFVPAFVLVCLVVVLGSLC